MALQYQTFVIRVSCLTPNDPLTIYRPRGEHASHYTTDVVVSRSRSTVLGVNMLTITPSMWLCPAHDLPFSGWAC